MCIVVYNCKLAIFAWFSWVMQFYIPRTSRLSFGVAFQFACNDGQIDLSARLNRGCCGAGGGGVGLGDVLVE